MGGGGGGRGANQVLKPGMMMNAQGELMKVQPLLQADGAPLLINGQPVFTSIPL